MTYSLLNAPALAFDVVRRPHGSALSALLVAALTADTDRWVALAEDPLHLRGPGPCPATDPATDASVLLLDADLDALVRDITLGHLDELRRFAVNDVLIPRALQINLDLPRSAATMAAFLHALTTTWEAPAGVALHLPVWVDELCTSAQLGTATGSAHRLLSTVAASSPNDRHRWRGTVAADTDPGTWATAMHEASWAVHLTDRITAAAVTQLLGVRAYLAAGFTLTDTCAGMWSIISGALQASVVADVLPPHTMNHLTPTWAAAQGPGCPS